MLTIISSPTYKPEREYICEILLEEFLGLEYCLQYNNDDQSSWRITNENRLELVLPDIFFQTPQKQWLAPESLPERPLSIWNPNQAGIECTLVNQQLPVLYGNMDFHKQYSYDFKCSEKIVHLPLPIDIFGSTFFMLSRYEEIVKTDRDEHDRFPAWASLAFQEGFLDRPIVNEYLEILWSALKKLWPGMTRKLRSFQMKVTCDVDHVFQESLGKPFQHLRTIGGDLIRRKNPFLALKSTVNFFAAKIGNYSFDPNLSAIDWIMDINEKAGNQVAFYFKAGCSEPAYDSAYSLDNPIVRKLLRRIHERGHEIGLHPSYNTYCDQKQLIAEANNICRVLEQEKIIQYRLGSRQHYLRWDTTKTPELLEHIFISYDSTLTFADHAGFRCGTCYEFPLFGLRQRRKLAIYEKPLLAMEGSVFNNCYMGMNINEGFGYFLKLKKTTHIYNGLFVILWHNNFDNSIYQVYKNII